MATNITKSDSTIISIADQQVDNDQLSIPLVGRNYRGYGQFVSTALVHILENFASSSEPVNPTEGQFWWDTSGRKDLKIRKDDIWVSIPYKEGNDYIFEGNLLPLNDCTNGDYNIGSPTRRFCVGYINELEGVAARSRYADLAELYKADSPLGQGTVVSLGGTEEITVAEDVYQVFGVVSTDPAFLMNKDEENDLTDMYPVALAGRVPVRVIGEVAKHDKLVLSETPGVARVKRDDEDLPILAHALKSDLRAGIKTIECVVLASIK